MMQQGQPHHVLEKGIVADLASEIDPIIAQGEARGVAPPDLQSVEIVQDQIKRILKGIIFWMFGKHDENPSFFLFTIIYGMFSPQQ
jgi:hypothetical protein